MGHYQDELEFDEDPESGQVPAATVGLFLPTIRDRVYSGEDAMFFRRMAAVGAKIHTYVGPGTPIAHHGTFKFQRTIEAFGLSRK